MKFKLEIELENDLMSTPEHLAMALEQVASRVRYYPTLQEVKLNVRDPNGNKCGSWEITKEENDEL
jgi:hypothetical protein